MATYLGLLFILLAITITCYIPFVIYGRLRHKARWQVGRNYLACMSFLLLVTGLGLYKALLDLSLASVARTGDTQAVGRLLYLGASPNARYNGVSALQNAYDRLDPGMVQLLEGAGAKR